MQLGALFGKDPADAKLYRLPLGDGQGVRDLTPYANGFLVLAGPAADGGGAYAIYWWDGESENIRHLRDLADVTGMESARPKLYFSSMKARPDCGRSSCSTARRKALRSQSKCLGHDDGR